MNKLEKIYKRLPERIEEVIDRIIKRREGGEYFSTTLRKLYKNVFDLQVGMFVWMFRLSSIPTLQIPLERHAHSANGGMRLPDYSA